MKRVIIAFIAGALFATASIGGATTKKVVRLTAYDHVTWHGVDCQATSLGASANWLTCVSSWNYSVIYGSDQLSVFRGKKIIFHRSR